MYQSKCAANRILQRLSEHRNLNNIISDIECARSKKRITDVQYRFIKLYISKYLYKIVYTDVKCPESGAELVKYPALIVEIDRHKKLTELINRNENVIDSIELLRMPNKLTEAAAIFNVNKNVEQYYSRLAKSSPQMAKLTEFVSAQCLDRQDFNIFCELYDEYICQSPMYALWEQFPNELPLLKIMDLLEFVNHFVKDAELHTHYLSSMEAHFDNVLTSVNIQNDTVRDTILMYKSVTQQLIPKDDSKEKEMEIYKLCKRRFERNRSDIQNFLNFLYSLCNLNKFDEALQLLSDYSKFVYHNARAIHGLIPGDKEAISEKMAELIKLALSTGNLPVFNLIVAVYGSNIAWLLCKQNNLTNAMVRQWTHSDVECPICYNKDKTYVVCSSCRKNAGCIDCIKGHIYSDNRCPLCRAPVLDIVDISDY